MSTGLRQLPGGRNNGGGRPPGRAGGGAGLFGVFVAYHSDGAGTGEGSATGVDASRT